MYTVIEYTNYRKEQSISVHGYFNDYDLALKYSKEKIKEENNYYLQNENCVLGINGIDCDIDIDEYI